MTVRTLRDLLKKQPFSPFRLVMSEGQTHEVRHPEMVFLTGMGIAVGFGEMDGGVPEGVRIYSLEQVSGVEPISAPSADAL